MLVNNACEYSKKQKHLVKLKCLFTVIPSWNYGLDLTSNKFQRILGLRTFSKIVVNVDWIKSNWFFLLRFHSWYIIVDSPRSNFLHEHLCAIHFADVCVHCFRASNQRKREKNGKKFNSTVEDGSVLYGDRKMALNLCVIYSHTRWPMYSKLLSIDQLMQNSLFFLRIIAKGNWLAA